MSLKKPTPGERIEIFFHKLGIREVYKWMLEEDFVYNHEAFEQFEDVETEWFAIKDGALVIKKGYAWNGCTPKYSLWDIKVIGTFDGPIDYRTGKQKCYYASLVHDALYQFKILDRDTTNLIFYELLKEADFMLAPIYYWVVKLVSNRYTPRKI